MDIVGIAQRTKLRLEGNRRKLRGSGKRNIIEKMTRKKVMEWLQVQAFSTVAFSSRVVSEEDAGRD